MVKKVLAFMIVILVVAGSSMPAHAKAYSEVGPLGQVGLGLGSIVSSAVYTPLKLTTAIVGTVTAGIVMITTAGAASDGASNLAKSSWCGDWYVTPDVLLGNKSLEVLGCKEVKTKPAPAPVVQEEPTTTTTTTTSTTSTTIVKIVLEDVHFNFNEATLTPEATEILQKNIKTMKENPGVKVEIEGNTCAHGSEKYNMALSERRANAVKEYLEKEGISQDRLTTIAYGKTRLEMPEIPTPKNKESTEAKTNRRVHFVIVVQ